MPVKVSCPSCNNQGELPDDTPPDATLSCRACGVRFPVTAVPAAAPGSVWGATPPTPPTPPVDSGLGVWLGDDSAVAAPLTVAATPAAPDITAANAAAHLEWLQAEVQRFEAHVSRQLAVLQKFREQVVAFENKARADAVVREQAAARDRAILDARARDLDAREAELMARLNHQAEELGAELDRQVAAERENLARRAEALTRAERSLERRLKEMEEIEEDVRREVDHAERLTVTPAPRSVTTTPPPTRVHQPVFACG
jgi:hypothetical protein